MARVTSGSEHVPAGVCSSQAMTTGDVPDGGVRVSEEDHMEWSP